jgi:putative adhesin
VRLSAATYHNVSLLVAASLISLAGCNKPNDRVVQDTFEQLYSVEPTADINIQNGDGTVLVYGSNVNEVQVRAVKKAYTRARLVQIAVDVSANSNSVSITTNFPPKPKWSLSDRSGTVDYTIVVPGSATISALTLDAGEILLDGLRGKQTRARLGDGRVFVRNCFGNCDVAIRRGNLSLSFDWWEKSTFSTVATITQGNAWAFFPPDADFHLTAQSVRGKIGSDFRSEAIAASASGMRIDAPVNGGGDATIKLHVVNGDVRIVEATQ